MHINKFTKKSKNKYKVCFDNEEITLYEDIILKYDLLLKKDIDIELLDDIINENMFYDAYEISLNYIEYKLRCEKEIIEYLSKKGFDNKYIEYAINKLNELKLLDHKLYIKSFINDKVNLTLDGPFKIKRKLEELNFNENEIDEYLYTFDDEIWKEKLNKLIDKRKNIMNNKSYYMFINKIKTDLFNLGYEKDMIEECLSNIEYNSNAIDKDLNKAIKKYQNDENKIINYLIRKGYSYEEIKSHLNA